MVLTPDDIQKLQYAFVALFLVVPGVAFVCSQSHWYQRAAMCLVVLTPTLGYSKISFTLLSQDHYRGHTTGFNVSLPDIIGLGLLIALWFTRHRYKFRFFPPGMIYFAIFYVCVSVSIFQAPVQEYSLMAMWNWGRMFLFYIIAYNVIRKPGDLRTILWAVAIALIIQCIVSIKMRYLDGVHQVPGMFDHQNSMASWAYFCGLPMLAMSLSRHTKWIDSLVYLTAYGCSGLLVILSISRGAFIMITVGSILIIAHAAFQKITIKRTLVIGLAVAAGSFVILMALDSILGRFLGSNDYDKKENLRTVLEEVSFEMLKDHPSGVGLNNYNVVNSRPYVKYSRMLEQWNERRGYWYKLKYYERNPNTENLYWMFLAETGYLGFAGLMIFFGYSLYVCLRNYHYYKDTRQGSFILGLIVTLMLFYAHSDLERVFTQTINMMFFVMFISVIAHYDAARRHGKLPMIFRLWKFNQAFWDTRKQPSERPAPAPSPAPQPAIDGHPQPSHS